MRRAKCATYFERAEDCRGAAAGVLYRKPGRTRGVRLPAKWKMQRHAGGVHYILSLVDVTGTARVVGFWKMAARVMRKRLR
jgi:hypothetical protein